MPLDGETHCMGKATQGRKRTPKEAEQQGGAGKQGNSDPLQTLAMKVNKPSRTKAATKSVAERGDRNLRYSQGTEEVW